MPATLGRTSSHPASAVPGAIQRAKSASARVAAQATAQQAVPHLAEIGAALDLLANGGSPFLDPVGSDGVTAPTPGAAHNPTATQSVANAATTAAAGALSSDEYPPLPALGKEVMTGSPSRSCSPGSPPHTSASPRPKGKGREVLDDEHLGGFLPTDMAADREALTQRAFNNSQDPDLQRRLEKAKQRSLTAMIPLPDDDGDVSDENLEEDSRDLHLQRQLERAKELSLASQGLQSIKSARRLEEREDSPPKHFHSGLPEALGSGVKGLNPGTGAGGIRLQTPSPLHPVSNPVLPRYRPEFDTVDGLPYGGDFGIVPEDPNEHPHIAGITADTMFLNIGPDQTSAWQHLIKTEPVILCYLSGGGSGNDDTDLATMKGMISIRTNAPLDSFKLSPPNQTGERPGPFLWLLHKLPGHVLEGLIKINRLSADGNTVFFNTQKEMTAEEVWAIYLGKVHASRIILLDKDGVPHTVWRIYGRATTNITDRYLKTLDLFYIIDFRSNFHGQGKTTRPTSVNGPAHPAGPGPPRRPLALSTTRGALEVAAAAVDEEAEGVLETHLGPVVDAAVVAEETSAHGVLQEVAGEDVLVEGHAASSPAPDSIYMYML
ncbi:hypothetical protein C8R43DRAFT_1125681 [Mycena crocata]|nr:hypothetical protein C8R43DRAFT_1125681 [Mycena crocata]